MGRLSALYDAFCKFEEILVAAFIAIMTGLIFVAAVSRTFGAPLNWAQDAAMLLFAWVVFLGADVALRNGGFIRVDMLVTKFPMWLQKILHYAFSGLSIALLAVILFYGVGLAADNVARLYQTIGISYSWATASAPVGSALMIVTIVRKLWIHRHDAVIESEGVEAI